MRRIWETPGGIHPLENKTQSTKEKIGTLDLPPEIILPLSQHIGAPAKPLVSIGQKILKGEVVAQPDGLFSAAIHASTSGEVIAIEERVTTHPSGMMAMCIVIKPDGKENWTELTSCDDYRTVPNEQLLEKIRNAGIVGMGGAGFPTAIKVNPKSNRKIDTLILNGTECEPYITADDTLMREYAHDILLGAQLLAHLLGDVKEILIGIEDNKPEAIEAMQTASQVIADNRIDIIVFPTKYPSGGEKQLIQILTGNQVPSGSIPAALGIVVQNIGTALAAHKAIKLGEPLISRVTTVVGKTLSKERNVHVLIGTPTSFVLAQHGFKPEPAQRLIIGGPMMGFAANNDDVPVVKTTNCILVPTKKELPLPAPAQPCIRCGMCEQACPASLLPQQLFWFAQSENYEQLENHDLFDCIECGACSYVCPSNIPLVQYYRASKGVIKQNQIEKEKSDKARERFEKRQQRIEKAEAEKEAKRQARKKAAEEAKRLLEEKAKQAESLPEHQSEQTRAVSQASQTVAKTGNTSNFTTTVSNTTNFTTASSNTTSSNTTSSTTTTSTTRSVDAKTVAPATQLAKLKRALSSASSRLDRANTQLETYTNDSENDNSRTGSLQAKVKQANQKFLEAKQKLADFEASQPEQSEQPSQSANTVIASQSQERKHAKPVTSAIASAAEQAIEKARANAAALANMSDEDKQAAKLAALKARVEKAKARLENARKEGSANIDAFNTAYEKLKKKLDDTSE